MTLLNAPSYNEDRENLKRNLLIGAGALVALIIVIAFAGILTGHGWFFSNLPAEHHVDHFLTDIEKKDFKAAYAIYVNDSAWEQHPGKYSAYPLSRFTEDWTTYSDVGAITSHHVDKSVTDGTGPFGTGIIVGATANGSKRMFIWYERKDGTLTYPPPHIFSY
jgi:hypothetical protein